MIATLVAVFVLSGGAGLMYESIWSRYLGLFVGHSAYAQIIVLAIFLGGMSLGAHIASRWSRQLDSPLLWYAGAELMIGVMAIAFHDSFDAVTGFAYDSVFPALSGLALVTAKWSIASVLILPQSILLGATFPLMSAGVIRLARAEAAPGGVLSLLYFANSIGAAVGVLVAGFALIGALGLPGTLIVAGVLNVLAAVVVGLMARAHEREGTAQAGTNALPAATPPTPPPATADVEAPEDAGLARVLLIVAFGTAVASFIYEIAWIRMLSLVMGSATHSFELMLSAFILGLALGSLWVRKRADAIADPVRFLGVVQWTMGLVAVATLPLYLASFGWIATVIDTLQFNDNGYNAFQFARYGVALLIMLPATFCAGMTLPLITRILMRGTGERAIGTVYAVNTLGSIIGVVLAGLLLMPVLGLKRLLVLGAIIDIALGVWLVAHGGRQRPDSSGTSGPRAFRWRAAVESPFTVPIAATVALLAGIATLAQFDLARITSGVYRHGVLSQWYDYTFPFYRDGRTATVSMRKSADGFMTLATNGKPDASMESAWMDTTVRVGREVQLGRDIATQLLLPLITLAHVPMAQNAAVIGHGSGMSSHVLLGSPHLREVVTIEIEPEMIEASRSFMPANRRVFEDARSTFVIDDARSYFASSRRKFDLILSEPSNPWVSGVSGLFTLEFYERVKDRLTEGAVFGQWLHLYELSDVLVTSVLAAIDSVFPSYEVFYTSNSDILIVAANDEVPPPIWGVTGYEGIERDLRRAVRLLPESFEALRLGGRGALHPLVLSLGVPNSDYFPVLDIGAERMRFMRESAEGFENLLQGRFDVVAALTGQRSDFSALAVTPTPEVPRAHARSLGARLRAMRELPADVVAQMPRDATLRRAAYRAQALDRIVAGSTPPVDWHGWMETVVQVDADLHSGTAGVVDSVFFRSLRGYAARAGAPLEARSAIDFLHGIGEWNWAEAAVAGRVLMDSRDSVTWIPDVLLRNGTAVSYIMLRDTAGAKHVLRNFANRGTDDRFRERLIASYLVYSDTTLRRERGWR